MKINITKVLTIIIISSIIGLLYNYINPTGLLLVSKNKELKWATDSILTFQKISGDTLKVKPLTIAELTNKIDDRKLLKGNDIHKEKNEPAKKDSNENAGFGEPLAINLEQAYKLYQMDVLFIDAREIEEVNLGRIKHSLSLPYREFDKYKTILSKIPKTQTIVCYCGPDCELSKSLANKLFTLGYHSIYVYTGGWDQWKNAGYPIE